MKEIDVNNLEYAEELYREWKKNPAHIPAEWKTYFKKIDNTPGTTVKGFTPREETETTGRNLINNQGRVYSLIQAYRETGYIFANLNPLGRYMTPELEYMYITMQGTHINLDMTEYGLHEEDLDTEFYLGPEKGAEKLPLSEIIRQMKHIYTSHIGYEFMHIHNKYMRRWLIRNIENEETEWPGHEKREFLTDVIKAVELEHFIHSNFIGQKRFSIEGSESLVPAFHFLVRTAVRYNIRDIVVGMTHRGRLNIMINGMKKRASEIFSMFTHNYHPHNYGGSGDVKYHLGQSCDYTDKEGNNIHISLVPNPSHLESVDPVVQGKTRGVQVRRGDKNRKKVLPVLIHGDAAFSGQGLVAETFNLSQLKGYRTGGTIHIIINNQIGFTTASRDARSTFFATDIAKTMPVPIFHVNSDDPEAVARAIDLALRWRWKFGYDVVVDIYCFRRLGHNESDEPSFTHPIMYNLIKKHVSVNKLYGEKLHKEGIMPYNEQEEVKENYRAMLKQELDLAKKGEDGVSINDAFLSDEWKPYGSPYSFGIPHTGVSIDVLKETGKKLVEIPGGFSTHPKLLRFVSARRKMIETGEGIDWACAESLAFGTLLLDGYPVRLSGEDSARGTFSQRHARWWDVKAPEPVTHEPVNHLHPNQAAFAVYDSPLSEYSVLGFEYGYACAQPHTLVIWEAQFGDFANGAQVIIDQFISAGESKWFRACGLVMLLPHGYEGQGPEHSSGYLERYLQLCADNNMQVCNISTPAQYFHLLRKQMMQHFRKPLIIMSPKSLLRHKLAVSSLHELSDGHFHFVLPDPVTIENPDTIILCSGKVFYDLITHRNKTRSNKTAIIRLEQLYPVPVDDVQKILKHYGSPGRLLWVQEEPENRGAWRFVRSYFLDRLHMPISYVGRSSSPSPATGSFDDHSEELEQMLKEAFA